MTSEEEYTEEIVTELDQENENGVELEEETEDFTAMLHNGVEGKEASNENHNGTEEIATESEKPAETTTENVKATQDSAQQPEREVKLVHLPLARIRNIMKLDPDLNIASNEALFAVTRATELFIESLTRESYVHTQQAKKKTVQKRDVDMAIAAVDSLMFLEGAMNF